MPDKLHISECPVCGSPDLNRVLSAKDWLVSKEEYDIFECSSCSFRFTQDAPLEKDIAPYYDDEGYVEHSDNRKGLINGLYHIGRKLMLNRKLKLIKQVQKGNTLLDVGSASGYFLNHMKLNGYEVEGVEISDKARKLCKEIFNIDTHTPNSMLSAELNRKYDIITLWHVFEHVYTYNEYFEVFKELLNQGGRLVIAMPNYQSYDASYYKEYWNAYDVPRHLWHFNPSSFRLFCEKRGFKLLNSKRLPLDPFYNSMVSADYRPSRSFIGATLLRGLWSYIISLFNKQRSSSLVYILEKTN